MSESAAPDIFQNFSCQSPSKMSRKCQSELIQVYSSKMSRGIHMTDVKLVEYKYLMMKKRCSSEDVN